MARFIDGPLAGKHLMLAEATQLLRAVFCGKSFDALDKPDDSPAPIETIAVYQRVGDIKGRGFRDGRDKNGRRTGGQLTEADYAYFHPQPADDQVRDNADWLAWCVAVNAQAETAT